jgi:hypothetical protein
MSNFSKRALFWAPRALSIAFLSIFALDVFDRRHSFWQTVLAFIIHEIPVFVLIAILILAWRWEWIGAALYAAAGLLDIVFISSRPVPPALRIAMILPVAGPAFVIAGLFLANWLKRSELRTSGR